MVISDVIVSVPCGASEYVSASIVIILPIDKTPTGIEI
jgi:hypothetical protein